MRKPALRLHHKQANEFLILKNWGLQSLENYAIIKTIEYNLFAGGLLGVEKVKPDPLNLLVNTGVGSKFWMIIVPLPYVWQGYF